MALSGFDVYKGIAWDFFVFDEILGPGSMQFCSGWYEFLMLPFFMC